MVENFTTNDQNTYEDDILCSDQVLESNFEENIKFSLQNLLKEPRAEIVESIMNYSQSLRK